MTNATRIGFVRHGLLFAIFAGLLMPGGCGSEDEAPAPAVQEEAVQAGASSSTVVTEEAQPATETRELSISGMHCDACANLIQKTLAEMPGVESAEVSFDEGRAVVVCDPDGPTAQQLAQAVRAKNYEAEPVNR